MRKPFCRLMLVLLAFCLLAAPCLGNGAAEILKRQERSTISLELEFSKKNPNALQRVISFLNWGPNGYATGFLVGGRLVMTAYHVVSGNLDESKKLALGFGRDDELEAKVYVGANALELPETGTTVRVKEGKRRVQDGPYADTKEQLAGFIILELPSVDAALEWAARCPGASIGAVEVRPLAPEAMRRGFTG